MGPTCTAGRHGVCPTFVLNTLARYLSPSFCSKLFLFSQGPGKEGLVSVSL